eukprot:CAMPEP_0117655824 /NCGR_PEP_ID=MMETSP0804-20121206/4483_1 /TAXON_ID=1074897 /ORGANISM="Tetraselmis astigmatica, Strain CCMP880" /LENGTH=475 /DNA_ID=CAMNT_0005462197 /DNA_START=247 /DNA_END=1673 /DNA_ORIENTATION=+
MTCRSLCIDFGPEICKQYAFNPDTRVCYMKIPCGVQPPTVLQFPGPEDMLEEVPDVVLSSGTATPVPTPTAPDGSVPVDFGSMNFPPWPAMPPAPSKDPLEEPLLPANSDDSSSGQPQKSIPEETETSGSGVEEFEVWTKSLPGEVPDSAAASFEYGEPSQARCLGTQMKVLEDSTVEECEKSCSEVLTCAAYSFNTNINKCLLMNSCTGLKKRKQWVMGQKQLLEGAGVSNQAEAQSHDEAWGQHDEYAVQCRGTDSSRSAYFCNADCAANCALQGLNGLLVPTEMEDELQYCKSTHSRAAYEDSTCCCGEHYSSQELATETVPCLGELEDGTLATRGAACTSQRLAWAARRTAIPGTGGASPSVSCQSTTRASTLSAPTSSAAATRFSADGPPGKTGGVVNFEGARRKKQVEQDHEEGGVHSNAHLPVARTTKEGSKTGGCHIFSGLTCLCAEICVRQDFPPQADQQLPRFLW